MTAVRAVSRVLSRIETGLLVTFLTVMIVLAFAQVVLRNLFGTSFLWGDILVRQMVLWAGFMGAALAALEDRHISIDALTKYLSPRIQHVVKVVTNLFAGATCAFLGRASVTMLADERANGGELVLGIPGWVALLIIPAGYFLLSLHFLLNAVDNGLSASRKESE